MWVTVFNILILIFTADLLTKTTGSDVKWSNLALISSIALLAVTLFNPLFDLTHVHRADATLLTSALILTAMAPTLRRKDIPTGLGAFPCALMLALLTGLHQNGILAALSIALIYCVRLFLDDPKWHFSKFFSLIILPGIPTLTWLMWQSLSTHNKVVLGIQEFSFFEPSLSWPILPAVMVFIIVVTAIVTAFSHFAHRQDRDDYIWLFSTAFILVLYNGACLIFTKTPAPVEHLQFIILVPFWRWIRSWYETTALKKIAYQSPWALGLSIAIFFVVLQTVVPLKNTQAPTAAHLSQISQLLKRNYLLNGDHIAVVDHPDRQEATLIRLHYHMGSDTPIVMDGLLLWMAYP